MEEAQNLWRSCQSEVHMITARDLDKEGNTGAAPVEWRKRRKLPMIERPRSAPIYAGQVDFRKISGAGHASNVHDVCENCYSYKWKNAANWAISWLPCHNSWYPFRNSSAIILKHLPQKMIMHPSSHSIVAKHPVFHQYILCGTTEHIPTLGVSQPPKHHGLTQGKTHSMGSKCWLVLKAE